MSRRIVYLFAAAGCLTFIAPAGADPECFDGVCRMPEVVELPAPVDEPSAAPNAASANAAVPAAEPLRSGPAPEPARPQMRVDDLPRPALRPLPQRPVEKTVELPEAPAETIDKPAARKFAKPARAVTRQAPAAEELLPSEPVEVVSRRYAPAEPQRGYTLYPQSAVPSAGVVIVAPGAQYGDDGIAVANARQDSTWQLCQTDGPRAGHNRCIQYNYQPYGAAGYRPLGTYRAYRPSPSYVYVPDAKVIAVD